MRDNSKRGEDTALAPFTWMTISFFGGNSRTARQTARAVSKKRAARSTVGFGKKTST